MPALARLSAPAVVLRRGIWVVLAVRPIPVAAQDFWRYERPVEARQTGAFANPLLTESSGVAASRRFPGVLWSHKDAGNDALLFATDTTGADLGTFRVTRAGNVDWEDLALAPCGAATCLYIADTGDNRGVRRSSTIYRVPEPDPRVPKGAAPRATGAAEALEFHYPDGPHDVEAMWVDPSGDIHLLTKEPSAPARHFLLPAEAWSARRPVTAEEVGTIPVRGAKREDRSVTGAALSPNGQVVAVRTKGRLYFFRRSEGGDLVVPAERMACDVRGLVIQGEGVTWLDDERLVLTSERAFLPRGTVSLVRCKLPRVPRAVRAR